MYCKDCGRYFYKIKYCPKCSTKGRIVQTINAKAVSTIKKTLLGLLVNKSYIPKRIYSP